MFRKMDIVKKSIVKKSIEICITISLNLCLLGQNSVDDIYGRNVVNNRPT